jgi:hypothetical protein
MRPSARFHRAGVVVMKSCHTAHLQPSSAPLGGISKKTARAGSSLSRCARCAPAPGARRS